MLSKDFRKNIHILVVDDEPIIRQLLLDLLQEDGYDVTLAVNGIDALEKMKHRHFHIIFSDIHMPNMDGLEFLRNLRKMEVDSQIIMMDSYPDYLRQMVAKEGALACLHKPFDINEIRQIVSKITQHIRPTKP
jgi:CheY-like chemotaxis protein